MVTSENISSDHFSPTLSAMPWPKPPSSLTRVITCQLPTVNSPTRTSNPLKTESGPCLSSAALHPPGESPAWCRPGSHWLCFTLCTPAPPASLLLTTRARQACAAGLHPSSWNCLAPDSLRVNASFQDLTQICPPGLWPPCPISLFFPHSLH